MDSNYKLPARARSWVGPPHLQQPSQSCPPGTWALAQPELVENKVKN